MDYILQQFSVLSIYYGSDKEYEKLNILSCKAIITKLLKIISLLKLQIMLTLYRSIHSSIYREMNTVKLLSPQPFDAI